MFVVGLALAMSSVTFTVAATESVVIILYPFALIFATSGLRSGTEKPMWLTVVPIVPPVTGADRDYGAAERVAKELLLGLHVRRVQMVVPVDDRTFSSNTNLRAG